MTITIAIWLSVACQIIGTIGLATPMFLPKTEHRASTVFVENRAVLHAVTDHKMSKPLTYIGLAFLLLGIILAGYAGISALSV